MTQTIGQLHGHPLTWLQASSGRTEYQLRLGDEPVANLRIRSLLGTLATGEWGSSCWTFKRVGFWQSRASIRACGADSDLAIFTNNTWDRGGTLEFADGRRFKATTSYWKSNLEFRTEDDQPVVHFQYGGASRRSATVELSPLATSIPQTPLLILFGWYLIVMLEAQTEMEAGAAVIM